jgi:IMP dehydrogenase/GMP reductase
MDPIRKVLSYNDSLLVPRHSSLEHLSDANINFDYFDTMQPFSGPPIINAPMDKVCSLEMINKLQEFDIPVTIHRWFKTVEEQIKFYEGCARTRLKTNKIFVAVGTLAKWKDWIDKLVSYRTNQKQYFGFLLDIANGDTKAGVETVQYLRQACPSSNIMAGNVATRSGFARLQEAGANFIRTGIGGSSICQTRIATGFGLPTLTSVFDCAKVKDTAYLVADGGTEYAGDICKAVAAGADMVMLGKMLAATDLSAGEKFDREYNLTENPNEYMYVNYSGMASREAIQKLASKRNVISVEGVSGFIRYTGKTEEVVRGIIGNLQAAVSYYAGCRTWEEFRRKVKFVEISPQGWEESKTRTLER